MAARHLIDRQRGLAMCCWLGKTDLHQKNTESDLPPPTILKRYGSIGSIQARFLRYGDIQIFSKTRGILADSGGIPQ